VSNEASFSNSKRCWAEIDLGALVHNARAVADHIGPDAGMLAAVKANAYGHGLTAVARALAPLVRMFGVANLAEAREVRAAVPNARVLLLSPALPAERPAIVADGFEPAVSSVAEAAAFAGLARPGRPVPVHFVIDTGMGRMGVWEAEAVAVFREVRALAGVRVIAVGTHLPCADEDEAFTAAQLARYASLVAGLRAIEPGLTLSHALNSAGLIRHPESAADLVRPGLVLYGVSPLPDFQPRLRPVLAMKSRVALVRDLGPGRGVCYGRTHVTARPTRAATLCAGYADGYPRHLSGSGVAVLIRGRRCPLLGRVTMDQIVVDATGVEGVDPGDEAVLLGRQGDEEITATELGSLAGTIPYEIFTGMQCRDGRVSV
jgi:alanine racemase